MARTFALATALGLTLVAQAAHATYSIVALERATGRFGVATASCVGLDTLTRVYAVTGDHGAQGRGAVLTQSYLVDDDASQSLALARLALGWDAQRVLDAMLEPSFDPGFALRQVAVLDGAGAVATFTGPGAEPHAASREVSDERFAVAVAGNLLTGDEVLRRAAEGFFDEAGCDLEGRLMAALVAASADGHGDARCVVDGRPAASAWLTVQAVEGDPLELLVESTAPADPVAALASEGVAWREAHPCPAPTEQAAASEPPTDGSGCSVGGAAPTSAVLPLLMLAALSRSRRRRRR